MHGCMVGWLDDCSFIFYFEIEVKVETCYGLPKNKAYKIILTKLYMSDISLTPSFSSRVGQEKTLKCFGAIFGFARLGKIKIVTKLRREIIR